MTNLKDNIWIQRCDSNDELIYKTCELLDHSKIVIYSGKTSEIPEEIAKECVEQDNFESDKTFYLNYFIGNWCDSFKEAIESAVTNPDGTIYPFIIIFKK
jgi:hypothetical protein